MVSKVKIEKRMRKKKNSSLVETIVKIKKKNPEIAKILSRPIKKSLRVNLKDIENKMGNDKNILIPGKILSGGEISQKVRVVAWSASEKAKEKMKKSGVVFVNLAEEIKKNPELKNLKVIK